MSFKHFQLHGADSALWHKPWRRVTDKKRCVIMRRHGEASPNVRCASGSGERRTDLVTTLVEARNEYLRSSIER